MKIGFNKIIVIAVALLLLFVGCSENNVTSSESNTAIDADVIIEDAPVPEPEESEATESQESESEKADESEPSEAEESEPQKAGESESQKSEKSEPIYIGVEKITLSKYSLTLIQGSSEMPIVTMHPTNATDKGEVWSSDNTDVATVNGIGKITGVGIGNCIVTVHSTDNPNVFAEVSVTVTPYVAPVEPEITYINGILIANKTYPLPSTYNPGVNPTANAALQEMFAAAKNEGLDLFVKSGFRSYTTQKNLYNNYVARDGKDAADRYSARPGHSEHQTGLGFDINKASSSFEGSPEAIWLAENCYKYGFIIRYPKDKEHITGYIYEPWHIRYLGVDIATNVYNSGLCLEEYLGITSNYQD